MQYHEIVAILRQDNPDADRALLTSAADWLLVWSRASRDVRERGPLVLTESGKQIKNPMMSSKSDAERALFGSKSNFANIYLSGAVKAMEESDGVEECDGGEKGIGRPEVSGDVCSVDLRGRGVVETVDRGPSVDVSQLGRDQGTHRKGYKRKIPARLRT